ncbi:DUF3303 domain-containing protein [Mesorhizobium sp. BR115XR7A]|uniref:DUF3303 domain-containing protein n=1 Tax=Mesorhizobium sp. BR115XR7A TaxID=2876645 RepID=UPI001CCCB09B|nr:DUF3303 family protein [Mesorhizobium sp. BR115XR7A]MBZ9905191.1 DUF3303 domain-containing protein [Mesorhizobium sp. BR115XR7A]MBZ9931988.1 DUF3303 domain-containing protein [Mesorhizobium sp. BR1-1-5]
MVPGAARPAGAVIIRGEICSSSSLRISPAATARKSTAGSARPRPPEAGGAVVHHSWIAADMSRCFPLVETDDVTSLQRWVVEWADLVEFEIVPVATSKDMVAALSGHL